MPVNTLFLIVHLISQNSDQPLLSLFYRNQWKVTFRFFHHQTQTIAKHNRIHVHIQTEISVYKILKNISSLAIVYNCSYREYIRIITNMIWEKKMKLQPEKSVYFICVLGSTSTVQEAFSRNDIYYWQELIGYYTDRSGLNRSKW